MKNYNVYKLFPTPIYHFEIENFKKLNIQLESYILDLKKKDKDGQRKSNYGGWHSRFFDQKNHETPKKFGSIIRPGFSVTYLYFFKDSRPFSYLSRKKSISSPD